MNKKSFIDKLLIETKFNESECEIINDILGSHFIVGKNNKLKILNDFKEKLNIDDNEADALYNTCVSILGNEFKKKIRHPFKSKEKK